MRKMTEETAKILIVGQEGLQRQALERALRQIGGCWLAQTTDLATAVALAEAVQPDLVLFDLRQPVADAPRLVREMRATAGGDRFLPLVGVLAEPESAAKAQLLTAGISDFLIEPFDTWDIMLRLGHLLDLRRTQQQLQEHAALLATGLQVMAAEMEEARVSILASLAETAEEGCDGTGLHSQRVGELAGQIAAALGHPTAEVESIRRAAPLHDLGKLQVPVRIWNKPGPLTAAERADMQAHTTLGACLLDPGGSPLLTLASEIALTHHERWDGAGYPRGLGGTAIPLAGRIVAVADAFDALTHARPHRPAWVPGQALSEVKVQSGRQFDPAVVDAFLGLMAHEPSILSTSLNLWQGRAAMVPGSPECQ